MSHSEVAVDHTKLVRAFEVIGLSAEMDVLLARAGDATKRPLLQGSNRREKIDDLLRQRAARYAQAHVTIDTSNLTVDQVVKKIMGMLEVRKTVGCKL